MSQAFDLRGCLIIIDTLQLAITVLLSTSTISKHLLEVFVFLAFILRHTWVFRTRFCIASARISQKKHTKIYSRIRSASLPFFWEGELLHVFSRKLTWLAGKSQFSIGNTSSNGGFSIAMLVSGGDRSQHCIYDPGPMHIRKTQHSWRRRRSVPKLSYGRWTTIGYPFQLLPSDFLMIQTEVTIHP